MIRKPCARVRIKLKCGMVHFKKLTVHYTAMSTFLHSLLHIYVTLDCRRPLKKTANTITSYIANMISMVAGRQDSQLSLEYMLTEVSILDELVSILN